MSFKNNVTKLDTIDSTNEEAFRRAEAKAKAGIEDRDKAGVKDRADSGRDSRMVVTAEFQTAGRGRMGRSFESKKSQGLYISFLQNEIKEPKLTAMTAVTVCELLRGLSGLPCKIKWPNDILLDEKKVCGILTEMRGDNIVIGIGINLYRKDFGELSDIATSFACFNVDIDKTELTEKLVSAMDKLFDNYYELIDEYLKYYRTNCCNINANVWLIEGQNKIPAFAKDIDREFALIVDVNGIEKKISSGEISVRPR